MLIHVVSDRGGLFNVWAIAFDPITGHLVGEPFPLTAFEGPGERILPDMGRLELGVGRGLLALPIVNPTGGICMIDNIRR